jgi:dsRNA-specific ribonuclease
LKQLFIFNLYYQRDIFLLVNITVMSQKTKEYIDTFFGTRNGIKGTPVENVNYTEETLTYMTPKNRGDEIVKIIVDRMKQRQFKIPFGVFECCAGIGGNTLSFLDSPSVEWTVSYEISPERRDMLRRNISMYKLESRCFIPNEGFGGVPPQYVGSVLYFDPPWLPSHIKGNESTKEDYVLRGIKIGTKTLEEWISECRHCSMIVMRVPPGYNLEPTPGFKYESMLLGPKKNSLLIIAYPDVTTTKIAPVQDDLNMEWYEGLRSYLRDQVLPLVVKSEENRKKLVSDEAMKVWIICFTHESYNPNVGQNYEELELVGDHSMESNFMMYLYLNYPKMTRSDLSQLKSHYMSKPAQAQMSLKLGLNKWVRYRTININMHTFEDIIEAFFGGLHILGDQVFKFGAGNGLCYAMINWLFEDTPVDREYTKGKPKTIIKETFEMLHWGKAIETYEKNPNTNLTTVTISFPSEAMSTLQSLGVNLPSPVIAIEEGHTKKIASDKAYDVTLQKIRAIGITEEWVTSVRGTRNMRNPELAPFVEPVQAKIKSQGFKGFYASKVQQTNNGKMFQLIGIKPDDTRVILEETDQPMDDTEGKKTLFMKYLNNN